MIEKSNQVYFFLANDWRYSHGMATEASYCDKAGKATYIVLENEEDRSLTITQVDPYKLWEKFDASARRI
jgi:hypothetical protein